VLRHHRITELAEASDAGRVRDHNEDRALGGPDVIAVADGMGGANAGEVAAGLAVEGVGRLRAPVSGDDLRRAIEDANGRIHTEAAADPAKAGMGTTVTAGAIEDGGLELAHVGDSRAYLWRDGELAQLTNDHSVVAELVRRGTLTPEEAERHPHRNVITRALGAEPEVEVDRSRVEVKSGDVVLITSDGLTTHLNDDQIEAVLREGGTLRALADRLVRRANAAGGSDNVTVVLARIGLGDAAADAREGQPAQQGETREMPVIRGVGSAPAEGDARPPAVLQPIQGRRRSRLRPAIVAVAVVLLLVVGAVAWVASRSYVITEGEEGTVQIQNGLPISLLGQDLAVTWQDTGIPAEDVLADDPGALDPRARGRGEAVDEAAALVWAYGVPEVPAIDVPEPVPAPRPTPRPRTSTQETQPSGTQTAP